MQCACAHMHAHVHAHMSTCRTWYLPCTRSPTVGAPRWASAELSSTHRAFSVAARAAFPTGRAVFAAPRVAFAEAVGRYFPGVTPEDLTPGYAGIRPKLQGPGQSFRDFVIAEGLPGLINLVGIESPGLTASEAIAERVENIALR